MNMAQFMKLNQYQNKLNIYKYKKEVLRPPFLYNINLFLYIKSKNIINN